MRNKTIVICGGEMIFKNTKFKKLEYIISLIDFKIRVLSKLNNLLKRSSGNLVVVSMDEITSSLLYKNNIEHKKLSDYAEPSLLKGSEKEALKIVEDCEQLMNSERYHELNYEGLSTWEVLNLFLHTRIRNKIIEIKVFENIINRELPENVIITHFSDSKIILYKELLFSHNINPQFFSQSILIKMKEIVKYNLYLKFKPHRKQSINHHNFTKAKSVLSNCNKEEGLNRAVVLTDTLRHRKLILPWYKNFNKDANNLVKVIGIRSSWQNDYTTEKLNYNTFDNYLNSDDEKMVQKDSISLYKSWEKFDFTELNKFLKYKNIKLFPLIQKEFFYYLYKLFSGSETPSTKAQLIGMVRLIKCLEKIILIENPGVFIIHDYHDWFEKVIILYCELRGIPTLMIQHGVSPGTPADRYVPVTKMALFGEKIKKQLLKRGYNKSQLEVVGSGQWDYLKDFKTDIKKVYLDLGIPDDKKIVVFATEVIDRHAMIKTYCEVFNAVSQFSDIFLVFKLHPSDSGLYIDEAARRSKFQHGFLVTKYDLHKLIYSSSLIINFQSTVTIESMLLNKPVIAINFSGRDARSPYKNQDPIINITKENRLTSQIRRVLSSPSFKKYYDRHWLNFIKQHCYKSDGNSSIRLSNLVNNMASINRKVKK